MLLKQTNIPANLVIKINLNYVLNKEAGVKEASLFFSPRLQAFYELH